MSRHQLYPNVPDGMGGMREGIPSDLASGEAPVVAAPPYQYVVVHRSAAALPGVLACQAIHAATECLRAEDVPVSDQTHLCVLVAEKSDELEALAARLTESGVHHVLIREPDPPYNGAATAVGCVPQDRARLRPLMAGFKVLR